MRILIRLPNWLGDLVMSTAFVRALHEALPDAQIEVIVKKGIDTVVDYIPGISRKWVFSKEAYPGLKGAWRFGKLVAKEGKPDIMFCLPESFSSAVMTWATGAHLRYGYRAEMRSVMFTKTAAKDKNLHRVDQYLDLLKLHGLRPDEKPGVFLQNKSEIHANRLIVNVNSEAQSRRLPVEKAVSVINQLRASTSAEIVLVGSPKELPHVKAVFDRLENTEGVNLMAGKTNLNELILLLGSAPVMLTTDSGPMHLANALGVHTVALQGAGDERNTAPYNAGNRTLIRSGLLPCAPCVKNTCKFGLPLCLVQMENTMILDAVTGQIASINQKEPL